MNGPVNGSNNSGGINNNNLLMPSSAVGKNLTASQIS